MNFKIPHTLTAKAIAISILTMLLGCNSNSSSIQLHDMEWLMGTWQSASGNQTLVETWTKSSSNTISGSVEERSSDTAPYHENLSIRQLPDGITLISNKGGQNVTFHLASDDKDSLVFENPAHDFPNKLTYIHKESKMMLVLVEGKLEGKDSKEQILLVRK
jgi:hypothetical protein